jgi:tetratricopeptide (TPR) repeat protein
VTAAIDWSYDLLRDLERAVFRRLSTFRGSFTVEAADALCYDLAAAAGSTTLDVLTLLVDKSLVQAIPPHRERYRCLEYVRRYAWDRLRESGELEMASTRHHDFYFALAELAAPELTGSAQAEWLHRLAADDDNLRAALEEGSSRPPEHRMRFALALQRYWSMRGHVGEGRSWVEDVLATGPNAPTRLRAQLLSVAASLAWQQGDLASARKSQEHCLAAWRELGDQAGIQYATGNLGLVAWRQGDTEAALAAYEDSLARAQALGNEWEAAAVLCNLGLLLVYEGEAAAGEARLREALAIMRALGDVTSVATVLADLGTALLEGGRDDDALELFVESLRIQSYLGARESLAGCLEGLASIASRRGRHDRTMLLTGAAEGIRQTIGPASQPWSERLFRGCVDRSRTALGAGAKLIVARGRELSAEEAIAAALEE